MFELIHRRAGTVIAATLALTAVLAVPFLALEPDETASQEPGGAVFDARDAIDERFVSDVFPVFFVTEADTGGNLLTRSGLLEVLAGEQALRADPDVGPALLRYFDADTATDVHGVQTIADLADARLAPGGLAAAADAEVAAAVTELVDEYGPASDSLGLSVQARFDEAAGAWVSPAIFSQVLGDNDTLGFGNLAITLGGETESEEWAREVIALLDAGEAATTLGVAIDVNLTSEEQGQAAGPFIGFTILAVLVIIGLTFRSYWVLAVTGAALGSLIVWLKGISNLIGLRDDLILSLVVPIAMISFGVDFAFHALGRYREERALGMAPGRSFVVGLGAVIAALSLALASDAAAFLANVSAGIESIVQFGIGAAVALGAAFLLLGIVTPLAVSVIEERVAAPRPGRARTAARLSGATLAGMTAMAAVLLMVYVLPAAGVMALAAYLVLFVALPAWRSRGDGGGALAPTAGSGSTLVGAAIARIAAARSVVLPVIGIVTVGAAFLAVRVPTEFDVKDFFAADTTFVRSLDALDEHVAERGGEPAQVYVAASMLDPEVLERIDRFVADVGALEGTALARAADGTVRVDDGSTAVLAELLGSQVALDAVAAATGIAITDVDGNAIPDTPEQLAATWAFTRQGGIPFDEQRLVRTPGDVRTAVWVADDASASATVFELGLTNSREQETISEVRAALAPLLDGLEADLAALDPAAEVELTGGPIVRQASLDAISRALQVSLPIALVVCLAIAALFLRSLRLGAVAIVPILMTVAWLYALMEIFGFAINVVTATIGAVSIGIGIDFAIHFTVRYREELGATGSRAEAVHRAGSGTGTALIASALSSAVGFGILAFAPMPLFASYGLLTAVMIVMALAASLLVLPGLLVLVTSDATEPAPMLARLEPQPDPAGA